MYNFTHWITLYSLAICPRTAIVNYSDNWNNTDLLTLRRATKRCSYYFPQSPCLLKLIKKQDNVYNAVCGKKVAQ